MLVPPKPVIKKLYYLKFLGLLLVMAGIPVMVYDTSQGSEIPLLVGLFMTLTTSEKIEDERSLLIKTTSLYFAFVISYGIKLMTTNLHSHHIINFELVEINHFLILILSLANFIFYTRMFIVRS
jgi:hypothetical protein